MENQEILSFCQEKNFLLDGSLLNLLSNLDFSISQDFIEKLHLITKKKFFNKNLIESNRDLVKKIIFEIESSSGLKLISLREEFELDKFEEKKEIVEKKIVYDSKVKIKSFGVPPGKVLEVKDFVNYFRSRYNYMKNVLDDSGILPDLTSINKLGSDKQKISLIGMIRNKRITKNNNLILDIEDLTGSMKVLISGEKEDLLKEAEDITLDSVIGFKGLGNNEIMFVNELVFPDVSLDSRKKGPIDECAVFIGDLHLGSHNFLEKDFSRFINFLSEENRSNEDSKKIKYLFIVGDMITGVGNYPDQEKDLIISELEEQFENFANYLKKIRSDIKIIISPGNHDGVRIMEPQPFLNEKYAWPLYDIPNVIVTTNPATVNIGEFGDFPGWDILTYHGFSFPYYANNIPKLMIEKTMNEPEKIMKYLLKNRHLAPTHGSTQYFPGEKDGLLIKEVPDIFVSGHTHKSGVTYYNNILIVSVSSWEGMTPYQEKFGNKPDHCKVPMINLKTRQVKILDFETGEDGIKTYSEEEDGD